jgi:putative NADPH-quinone reductase
MNVLIIDGHPDMKRERFCHAIADSYAQGAAEGDHDVRRIDVARLDFPLLLDASHFGMPPDTDCIRAAQSDFKWADHVVLIFPIWLGALPALLKAFLEQVARGGLIAEANRRGWRPRLKGRSARVIATMGMPELIYRWIFGAHAVAALKAEFLRFAGLSPVRATLMGAADSVSPDVRARRLARVRALGRMAR